MEPQVCLLTRKQVAEYWDQIEWRFAETRGMDRFYTKEDIIELIKKDEMQVWTAGENLVLLTQVITTPIGKVMQVVFAHGIGMQKHWEELKDKFHTFAWMTECVRIEVLGRPGWQRKFMQEEGFKIAYVAYSADVVKPRMN